MTDRISALLEHWARFYYHYDYGGLGYPHQSVIKPTIRSTKPRDDMAIPDMIESIDMAIIELTLRQKQVINIEYLRKGSMRIKAKRLSMSYKCYTSTLSTAKKRLSTMLDGI